MDVQPPRQQYFDHKSGYETLNEREIKEATDTGKLTAFKQHK